VRALLIANHDDADAGFVGERLRHHGFAFTECHRERPSEWPDLVGHDLVLQLGSEWSVYWPQVAAEVAAEVALVSEADRRAVPIFGICFGHQVLCHALGGGVERAATPEVGWFGIESAAPETVPPGPWLQWHYDVAAPPDDAVVLARSDVGVQAWRRGRTFATQFHPEATERIVGRWSSGAGTTELQRLGIDPEALRSETRQRLEGAERRAYDLVDWFVGTICDAVHVA